jgi:hypothetical protein
VADCHDRTAVINGISLLILTHLNIRLPLKMLFAIEFEHGQLRFDSFWC